MKKCLRAILLLFLIISITTSIYAIDDYSNVKAKVVQNNEIKEVEKEGNIKAKIQNITLRILEGEYQDEECKVEYVLQENVDTINSKQELEVGTKVIVNIEEKDGEIESVNIKEIVRQNYIIYMLLIILVTLIVVAWKKSIKPIIVFVCNLACIYLVFVVPALKGYNILLTSIITSVLIAIIGAISQIGLTKNSYIAIISSVVSTCICIILAKLFFDAMKISGQIFNMSINNISLNIKELLYAGLIISLEGVNISVANHIIASQINIKQDSKETEYITLYKNGLNYGIDFICKIINIPMLLYLCVTAFLIAIFTQNINNEVTAITFLYLCISIIGGVITILITSSLYALKNRNKTIYKTKSDNIIKGQRSLKI